MKLRLRHGPLLPPECPLLSRSVGRHLQRIAITAIALCVFLCPAVLPQTTSFRFRHFSVEQGLSQSTVSAIAQDRFGYLWFGTQDGLNRYDGCAFTTYRHDPKNPSSLSGDYVSVVCNDSRGDLWIGTYGKGLNLYDPGTDGFRRFMNDPADSMSLSGDLVTAIAPDPTGGAWIGIWRGGLNRLDPATGKCTRFRHDPADPRSIRSDKIVSLHLDSRGILWIGTWDGLDSYNAVTGSFRHHEQFGPVRKIKTAARILAIFEDRDQHLWFSLFDEGLLMYDRRTDSFTAYRYDPSAPSPLGGNEVRSICQDQAGIMWFGTRVGGLSLVDVRTGRIELLRHVRSDPASLSDNPILSLCHDRDGAVWVGTDGGGINLYDPHREKFLQYRCDPSDRKSLSHPLVRAVCEDSKGVLWVGSSGGGLDRLDPGGARFVQYQHDVGNPQGLSHSTVHAILEDHTGTLWVGTDGGGLDRYNRRTDRFDHFRHDPVNPASISSDYIMTLYETKDGALWIGTSGGGLCKLERSRNRFVRYLQSAKNVDGLSGQFVWSIREDSEGFLWLGTREAGIVFFDPRTESSCVYRNNPADSTSLSRNTVFCSFEDRDGNIWIGTAGGGLDCYDRQSGTFRHYTTQDGLPNNVINSMVPDAVGNLWLTTNNGLCRFTPATGACKTYDVSDGLLSNEFNQGASFRSRSGKLYVGGINGLNAFFPSELGENENIPPVHITQFRVFDRPVRRGVDLALQQPLYLSPSETYFSFEFVSLSYTAPEKNSYAYKLEGFDKDWVLCGNRRLASYTNLKGGDYTFLVRGSNNDGLWNEQPSSTQIHIASPYWETPMFRYLLGVLVVGVAYSFYRSRTERLRKEKAAQLELSRRVNQFQDSERKRIASALHDSLGQELLVVKNSLELLTMSHGTPPAARNALIQLADDVQGAINDLREISFDLHPHTLDSLGLRKAILSVVRKSGETSPIQFSSEIDSIDGMFSPSAEIHMYRLVQECLNNVVRHSGATNCTVAVRRMNDMIEVSVHDDGRGFDGSSPTEPGREMKGVGLSSMSERAAFLKGKMSIRSAPGTGTTVTFQIPVPETRSSGE